MILEDKGRSPCGRVLGITGTGTERTERFLWCLYVDGTQTKRISCTPTRSRSTRAGKVTKNDASANPNTKVATLSRTSGR